jgi:hypothetical protein
MACVNSYKEAFIDRAVEETLPQEFGQRNRQIFEFARQLRNIFDDETDPDTLRPYVAAWHKKALPYIRTKEFEETWTDFVHAWVNVSRPAGRFLEQIKRLANEDTYTVAQSDINLDKVARVFRAGGRVHGKGQTFFLDYRTLGGCVGLSAVASRKIALKLVELALLARVENGTVGKKGKATVWRWLGPLEESSVTSTEIADQFPKWAWPQADPATESDSDWDWPP